ncbi:hypothetical protein CVT24_005452 [Panaeolus cyanescens]|uniref:Uncharacterized protein n=1 Tax=Panaeolus cyanescens TaxID=181874 RepID=A0A409WTE8_9AGAR|nr:hypothetical protein CVT24_005452 [Panaeolus cyanescens]
MFPANFYNSQPTIMWLPIQPTFHYPHVTLEEFDLFHTEDDELWVYKRWPYHSGLHYDAYAPLLGHQTVEVPFEDIAMPIPRYANEWVHSVVDEVEAAIPISEVSYLPEPDQQLQQSLLWTPLQCRVGDPVGTALNTHESSPLLSSMSETIEEYWSLESECSLLQDERFWCDELSQALLVLENTDTNTGDLGPVQSPREVVERQEHETRQSSHSCWDASGRTESKKRKGDSSDKEYEDGNGESRKKT